MKSKLLYIVLLWLPLLAIAQERENIKGRVYSGNISMKDVLVVNNSAQIETRTDSLGNFTLKAKINDLLIVSDYKLEIRKIRYTPDLVRDGFIQLEVKMNANELDEVVINHSTITSQSLGLPMGKAYTVQERRLRAGSSDPLGSLINILSGRMKMLKRSVEIEKREIALDKLDELFDTAFYTEQLKIEADKVNGFKYYAVENDKLREELKTAKAGTIKFTLAELAEEYKKISNEE